MDIRIKPGQPLAYLRRAPMWLVLLASHDQHLDLDRQLIGMPVRSPRAVGQSDAINPRRTSLQPKTSRRSDVCGPGVSISAPTWGPPCPPYANRNRPQCLLRVRFDRRDAQFETVGLPLAA